MQHPTIDLEFGLKQLSGNKTLLLRMLNKFRDEYTNVMEKLDGHLNSDEYPEAQRVIHTIKGVAGNLGLSALHHMSREYEAFLKTQQPDMEDAKRQFAQVLAQTLTDIDQLEVDDTPAETEAAPPPASEATATQGRQELLERLGRNEFINPANLGMLLQQANLSANVIQSLKQHINDLEYPEAIAILEKA